MNFGRAHEKLISFILSMMMTSAFFATAPQGFLTAAVAPNLNNVISGLRSAGWSVSDNFTAPTSVQTPEVMDLETSQTDLPFSKAEQDKIDGFFKSHAKKTTIGNPAADKLKILDPEAVQIHTVKDFSGKIHAYSRLKDGGIVLSLLDATTAYSYHLDSKFKLIASVAVTNYVASDIADPETSAKAELAYWAAYADRN